MTTKGLIHYNESNSIPTIIISNQYSNYIDLSSGYFEQLFIAHNSINKKIFLFDLAESNTLECFLGPKADVIAGKST